MSHLNTNGALKVAHPSFEGMVGVARRDITPPMGIYSRMWGSAIHDVAEGVHRPLTATAVTMQSLDGVGLSALVSLDLGWWRSPDDEWFLREAILDAFSLDESRLMVHLTHTHAGPSISLAARSKPGGDKIEGYLFAVRQATIDAIRDASASARQATLMWHFGTCRLARHRDQRNPCGTGTVVGYDPTIPSDDTLLVGRITDSSARTMATVVNYACHPTTLAWGNRSISPDFVGSMREIVETETNQAPCMFLNGAAGDLAPRRQHLEHPSVADQNGRQLGYAVLSTLEDMFPHQQALSFHRIEESTTRIGCWRLQAVRPSHSQASLRIEVRLPLCELAPPTVLNRLLESTMDRAAAERFERMSQLFKRFHGADHAEFPIWIWRLGDAIVVGTPAEMHSPFQMELRRRFPNHAVVVLNIVNGTYGYVPPQADFALDTYECNTSLFKRGAHERIIEACSAAIGRMLACEIECPTIAPPHFRDVSVEPSVERLRQ